MTTVLQAYRFALDPTEQQRAMLSSHCGGARFAFNWGLARVEAVLDQRSAERSYGLDEDQLTPAMNWSAHSLRKSWNAVKGEVSPWWAENSKEAYASGLANLADALGNWHKSRIGKRAGKRVGVPRFKSKRGRWSFCISTGQFGLVKQDRRHVTLPRIGSVRTHESTRKLARHVERGTARIRSATVSFRRGRWHVSFSVEITKADPNPAPRDGPVGVDLGVKHLAVLSTGETIDNPKHLDRAQRKLRRLQRQASRRRAGAARRSARRDRILQLRCAAVLHAGQRRGVHAARAATARAAPAGRARRGRMPAAGGHPARAGGAGWDRSDAVRAGVPRRRCPVATRARFRPALSPPPVGPRAGPVPCGLTSARPRGGLELSAADSKPLQVRGASCCTGSTRFRAGNWWPPTWRSPTAG
ncbi:RNA-guided endonuclease TnpB family protein [Actinopolyspora biskrensis]|uniref:RNA-guided endonuclease TnpB family protein n=1 Tax=Actinopolyspora biskrensis TaxID=1470178 RepID=UPI001FE8D0F1|nr:RNA-guided endonuclease TnpB family protein [Actinopolyspora biskrensis]